MMKVFFKTFFSGLRFIPFSWRYKIGDLVGSTLALIPTSDKKVAELQLAKILKTPDVRMVLKKMYQSLCYTFLESVSLDKIFINPNNITISDQSAMGSYLHATQGRLILTAHFSNWELLGAFFAKVHPRPVHVIGRAARNESLNLVLNKLREDYGVRVVDKNDKSGALKTLKALKRGDSVGVLIDQDTSVTSRFVPFFGMPAKTPSALVDAALRTDSKIFVSFLIRLAPLKYEVMIWDVSHLKDQESILNAYSELLQNVIKNHPEQWVWIHKRWRSRPDGSQLRTKEYISYLENL
jgi:lauroyl/myristoyl acyltransferase